MAKVIVGPNSGQMYGRIGGTVYAASAQGFPYLLLRSYVSRIANPRTLRQIAQRTYFTALNAIWQEYSDAEQAYWNALAQRTRPRISGWNLFSHYNGRQMSLGYGPQLEKHGQHLAAPTAPTALAATVFQSSVIVTLTDAAFATCTVVCVGTAGGFTPSLLNLIAISPATDGEDRQFTVPLPAGTYYLKAFSTGADGGCGAPTASVGPVVVT
jgi:hypothetical protein